MLQRGRGLGWRRAVDDLDAGPDLLTETLSTDPRWDHQVESRREYYATLAAALGMTALDLLQAVTPSDEDAAELVDSIVAEMARRGDLTGVEHLKGQLAVDNRRDAVLADLIELGSSEVLAGVPEALVAYCSDDDLVDVVRYAGRDGPWPEWARAQPRIEQAVTAARAPRPGRRSEQRPPIEAPIEVVLAYDWPMPFPKQLLHRLVGSLEP